MVISFCMTISAANIVGAFDTMVGPSPALPRLPIISAHDVVLVDAVGDIPMNAGIIGLETAAEHDGVVDVLEVAVDGVGGGGAPAGPCSP